METPKTATGSTQIPVRAPAETEVIQAERGVINPQAVPTFPLEEPLDPNKYFCGRGDSFELNFWGQQNFKLRVTVDIEGRTFISKVGYVNVVGKTLAEARTIISKAVHRFYPGLNFDLTLASPRTFLVHVVGYVHKPGIYPSSPIQRVATLLKEAGGITGSTRRIEIRRRDGSRVMADLLLYELTGETDLNPFLMDGDIIDVPFPGVLVSIEGPVKRDGRYELIKTKDMHELFDLAGGFRSAVAKSLPVRVIRRDGQQRLQEVRLPFDSALAGYALHDEDRVIVPSASELQRGITLIGPVAGATAADEVTTIRRLEYYEGATVRTLVEGAGAVGASADLKSAYVKSPDGKLTNIDLEAMLVRRDFSVDRPVSVGDTIVIPQKRRSVVVEGSVFHPGIYPYNPHFGPSEYLVTAGGVGKNAQSAGSFRVLSADGHARQLKKNSLIEPGDTIVIPERAFSRSEVVQLVMGGVGLLLSAASLTYLVVTR